MAQYKILADSITGKGRQIFAKNDVVDGDRLVSADHIPALISSGLIEEIKPIASEKPKKTDTPTV